MKKSGKVWVVVVIVLAVIMALLIGALAYLCYLYNLATDTSEASKLETIASTTIYEPLVRSIVLGEEQTITDDDINGIIKKIMDESIVTDTNAENAVLVNGIAIYLQGEQSARIYADIGFKNIRMIFSADAEITLNNEDKTLTVDISKTKLGKLEIPSEWIMNKIGASVESISESIDVNSTAVTVPAEYSFTFMEKEVELNIEKLDISQGTANVQTNSTMNLITQFIDEFVSSWIAES